MITNLKLPFDMEKNFLAMSQEHRKNAPTIGESLKIYIPLLMLNIDKSNNVENNMISSNNYQTFLNDSTCRPRTQNIINTQNYITAKLENNTSWIIDNDVDKNKTKWINIVKQVKKVISELDNIKYRNPITTEIVIGDNKLNLRTDCVGFLLVCLEIYTGREYNFICQMLPNESGVMKSVYNFSYKPFINFYNCETGDVIGNSSHVEIFSRIDNFGNVYVYKLGNNTSISESGEEISCNINTFNNSLYSYVWTPPYDKNCIDIGDKIQCHAINGRLDKMCYNNNIYI